jgi:hypothetical protein
MPPRCVAVSSQLVTLRLPRLKAGGNLVLYEEQMSEAIWTLESRSARLSRTTNRLAFLQAPSAETIRRTSRTKGTPPAIEGRCPALRPTKSKLSEAWWNVEPIPARRLDDDVGHPKIAGSHSKPKVKAKPVMALILVSGLARPLVQQPRSSSTEPPAKADHN